VTKILLVDDEPSFLATLTALLRKQDYNVESLDSGEKALEILKNSDFDLVLTDIRMEPVSGLDLLDEIQRRSPETPVIMITADDSIETAVEAMRIGAFDYVTKPFKVDELFMTVKRALEHHEVVLENIFLRNQLESKYHLDNIVAESPNMQDVCEAVERAAPTNVSVLITGETGTGKDLIAHALHLHSNRRDAPFVRVGCASISGPAFSDELFGAAEDPSQGTPESEGLFHQARNGTLFIDDIDRMPLDTQERMATVLKNKRLVRNGGSSSVPVDVRLLAATSRPIQPLIDKGEFLKELYRLIAGVPINIAPLRERPEDLMPLISYFIQNELGEGRSAPTMEKNARKTLEAYHWPGNVRELASTVRSVLASNSGDLITRDDFPSEIMESTGLSQTDLSDDDRGRSLKSFMKQKEKEYIVKMVEQMGGDRERAAAELNISLDTLKNKMEDR